MCLVFVLLVLAGNLSWCATHVTHFRFCEASVYLLSLPLRLG